MILDSGLLFWGHPVYRSRWKKSVNRKMHGQTYVGLSTHTGVCLASSM